MSNKLVRGKDVLVYWAGDTIDKPIICSRSCTFTKTFEVKETTHYTSLAKEFRTGMYEWDISIDGIVTVDVLGADDATIFDFLDGQAKDIKVVFTDGAGTDKTATGTVIPPSVSITADVADFAGYSLQLKGTGELTIV